MKTLVPVSFQQFIPSSHFETGILNEYEVVIVSVGIIKQRALIKVAVEGQRYTLRQGTYISRISKVAYEDSKCSSKSHVEVLELNFHCYIINRITSFVVS
jgi:hypothetical protein